MEYEVKKMDAGGRIGYLKHNGKTMITPNLFPVVSPFSNLIPAQDIIDEFHGSSVFTNAYILYSKPEQRQIAIEKGIHNFINFNGLIATDSGAFQHYMYGEKEDITAEEIENFQENIKSDFPVILDLPVQLNDVRSLAESKIDETIIRATNNVARRRSPLSAWFGPIHGGINLDLVKKSTLNMTNMDFGIYAIGGVVKTFNDYMFDISLKAVLTCRRYLRPDRPLHLFGAGLPQFFALSVACGVDTMDSAAYILFAKEGRYMTLEGTKQIQDLQELPCNCPICSKYDANELKDLYKGDKNDKNRRNQAIELIARHNLYISFGELKTIRESIREGNLWELVEQRIHAHTRLIKAYKELPKFWNQLEKFEPVDKPKATFMFGEISNSRPIRFRIIKKIIDSYNPNHTFKAILIPELDTSTYNSKTLMEFIAAIDNKNSEIIETNSQQPILEKFIISNILGPIPYSFNSIYPISQREWINEYVRTNPELFSIMKMTTEDPRKFMNFNEYELEQSNKWSNMILSKSELDDYEEILYDNRIDLSHDLIINRIEISKKFFSNIHNKITEYIILKPKEFTTEEGYQKVFRSHLIDDIPCIIDNLNKTEKKSWKIIEKIEDLNI